MASQEQRKAETRQRLLDAAALLFAERGIDAVSIDTVAEAADRTSGAVYAHFGGKDGLLSALLERLVEETAAIIDVELAVTDVGDEQLAALWHTFSSPPPGPSAGWMLLEHELWLYASRHDDARDYLAARYEGARRMVVDAVAQWEAEGRALPPGTGEQVAPLLVGLLLGLEMQHRMDPDAVPDDAAVIGLRALTGLGAAATGTTAAGRPEIDITDPDPSPSSRRRAAPADPTPTRRSR